MPIPYSKLKKREPRRPLGDWFCIDCRNKQFVQAGDRHRAARR